MIVSKIYDDAVKISTTRTSIVPRKKQREELFPNGITNMISDLADYQILLDWIDPDKLVWDSLSANTNPFAMYLLEKKKDEINWDILSKNPSAIELLEKAEQHLRAILNSSSDTSTSKKTKDNTHSMQLVRYYKFCKQIDQLISRIRKHHEICNNRLPETEKDKNEIKAGIDSLIHELLHTTNRK